MDISKVIILSDMDGTLLNSNKEISIKNREAIRKFTELGGKFTIATGRTIHSFVQYVEMLDLRMPVIMYNGGMIYDYQKREQLYKACLDEKAREMTKKILFYMPENGGEVLRPDNTYVFSNTEYQQYHTRICGVTPEYMDITEIPGGDWLKVLFSLAPEKVSVLENLIHQLGFDSEMDFVRSSEIFLEMLPKGISKGSAIQEYRKLSGMEDFTFVSIGDFNNDIEMIEAADIGACPANAEEAVKNAADIILTKTNDEDAVAELIDTIINMT